MQIITKLKHVIVKHSLFDMDYFNVFDNKY